MNTLLEQLEKKPCLLEWTNGTTNINSVLAFEMFQTHGLPREIFFDEVSKYLEDHRDMLLYHTVRAYDEAHGTDFHSQLKGHF